MMKTFISVFSVSSAPMVYEGIGNSKLTYKETRFPILPLLNGYAERNDRIRVILIIPDTSQCYVHLTQLKEEIAELQQEKGFLCKVHLVFLERTSDVQAHMVLAQELIEKSGKDCEVYAVLPEGIEGLSIMASVRAMVDLKRASLGCIAQTQGNQLIDVTAIAQLPDLVEIASHTSTPVETLRRIIEA